MRALLILIISCTSAMSADYKYVPFIDLVTDIHLLAGQKIEVAGRGYMHGDSLWLIRDKNSTGTFVVVQIDDIAREQKRVVIDKCLLGCDAFIQGEIGADEKGSKGIIADKVEVR